MKMRNLLFLGVGLLSAAAAQAGVIISEVVDGTLSGGNPKFVELTNTMATDFTFTGGGIIQQSNAATDLDIDVDLTGVTIAAGDSYVIQSGSNDGQAVFESTYGFAADLYTPSGFFGFGGNGDDRFILTTEADSSILTDIYGVIDVDGTGESWEYTDSYAFRLPNIVNGNGGAFAGDEWFIAGPNALETGNDIEEAALLVALTSPGTHLFVNVPEPTTVAMALLGLAAVASRKRS